jgi:hypothetical protein
VESIHTARALSETLSCFEFGGSCSGAAVPIFRATENATIFPLVILMPAVLTEEA